MQYLRTACVVVLSALATANAAVEAPQAVADPVSTLTRAVDAARQATSCSPLQSDPLVERAADMALQSTSDYIRHRSAAQPITDPMPALKTIGYMGSKALLLSGYGTSEADAIRGLILQGYKSIPNCQYTQFGVSAISDDGGLNLTAVVLAAQQ